VKVGTVQFPSNFAASMRVRIKLGRNSREVTGLFRSGITKITECVLGGLVRTIATHELCRIHVLFGTLMEVPYSGRANMALVRTIFAECNQSSIRSLPEVPYCTQCAQTRTSRSSFSEMLSSQIAHLHNFEGQDFYEKSRQ